jgi:hypothetical protein
MLFSFRQIVFDALALQMARQWLATTRLCAAFSRCAGRRLFILVVIGFFLFGQCQPQFGGEERQLLT